MPRLNYKISIRLGGFKQGYAVGLGTLADFLLLLMANSFVSQGVRKRENKVIVTTGGSGVQRSPRGIMKSLGFSKPSHTMDSPLMGEKQSKFKPVSEISESESYGGEG